MDQLIADRLALLDGHADRVQHEVRLALEEQVVGLGPARRHGDDVVLQRLPNRRCLVAVGLLNPEHEA